LSKEGTQKKRKKKTLVSQISSKEKESKRPAVCMISKKRNSCLPTNKHNYIIIIIEYILGNSSSFALHVKSLIPNVTTMDICSFISCLML
jgi:hypothetical protein